VTTPNDDAVPNNAPVPALSPIGLKLTEITEYDPAEYKGMMKSFGPACEAVIKQHELPEDMHVYLHEQSAYHEHIDWYMNLVVDVRLSCEVAYELTVAMHLDAGIQFDEHTCITPSAKLWETCL
jgi:hypothetical protein